MKPPKSNQATTSAVVSAFNEEKHLAFVLKKLLEFNIFKEIICVNDGSTDKTKKIMESFGSQIKSIHLPENKGKSYAMVAGVKAAKGDIIVFCDADLISIRKTHLTALINSLIYDLTDAVLAFRKKELTPFRKLTGERAYWRKDLLPHLNRMENTKFGIETYLNHIYDKKRIIYYLEDDLTQSGKKNKRLINEVLAADAYLKEGYEIMLEILRQKKPLITNRSKKSLHKLNQNYHRFLMIMKNYLTEKDLHDIWEQDLKKLKNFFTE